MGKKNKRKRETAETAASTSHGSKKSRKPGGSPGPPPRVIRYEDMPLNHKKKFYINDDCGSVSKYIEIISWLRSMGCYDGSVFEGIQNLNWAGEGYPVVEVEVVSPKGESAKFIVVKENLYIIAFLSKTGWYHFNVPDYRVYGFQVLEHYDGKYTGKPWTHVGPKCMINALDHISRSDVDANGEVSSLVTACEIFYVHLSEAARLYPIESLIRRSLAQPDVGMFDKKTYEDEEKFILDAEGGQTIGDNDDVLSLVRGVGPINFNLSVQTPDFIGRLIKKYSHMSKVWYVYSLTGRKVFEMGSNDVSMLHMKSRKSLRGTLAVLCNINLDKVLREWECKSESHQILTAVVYEEMKTEVCKLQAQKKVLLPQAVDNS